MEGVFKKISECEKQILPDDNHPFWDWFWGQVKISNLIHEIDKNLCGETAWDYFRRKAKEKS